MTVYDVNGDALHACYDVDGNSLTQAYDVDGNPLFSGQELEDLVPNRLLVWHDEFEDSNINSKRWGHLFGYYNSNRYYMLENDLAHNAYCENSILHINNRKDSQMPNTPWTGAFIHTNNLFEFKYGLVEAKIKFPSVDVYHSTFWTLGANYERINNADTQGDQTKGVLASTCGEIDIAEADGGTASCTKHWAEPSSNTHQQGGHATLTRDASNWHIYGIEWTENEIKTYIDRELKNTWSIDEANYDGYNAFRLPHFLMLNQNPYLLNSSSQTEDFLETLVDWVRVYAPVGVTSKVRETNIKIDQRHITLNAGETFLLTGVFTPSNVTDMTLLWSSDNPNVAECYGGKVTALFKGTATVSCKTKHGLVASCKVVVS